MSGQASIDGHAMSTAREMWTAASTLMGYWNRLSDDRGETEPEPEYSRRLAEFPDGTRTDMELIVLGFNLLRHALATFDPDQWAPEEKTQSVYAMLELRIRQESVRAEKAEARLRRIALMARNYSTPGIDSLSKAESLTKLLLLSGESS